MMPSGLEPVNVDLVSLSLVAFAPRPSGHKLASRPNFILWRLACLLASADGLIEQAHLRCHLLAELDTEKFAFTTKCIDCKGASWQVVSI